MDRSKEKQKRFVLFKDKESKRKVPSLKKPSFKLSAEPVPSQASSNRRSTCLTWCWPASSAPRPDPVDSKCVPELKSASDSQSKDKTKSAVKAV
ncbi:hypothetical protein ATANTOWER_018288, partial [Ataeniobius toweri]|nr:hypothetical protein [Ataeniobius toweri]